MTEDIIRFRQSRRVHINKFYNLLCECFPYFSYIQYRRIVCGKHFVGWVWGEDQNGIVLSCVAIFKRENGYKMGLFCTHPNRRRQNIGTRFYNHIKGIFNPLEWNAITPESIQFYNKIGAINCGIVNGGEYTLFKSQ